MESITNSKFCLSNEVNSLICRYCHWINFWHKSQLSIASAWRLFNKREGRLSRKFSDNITAPRYPVLSNMCSLPRQSIDRSLSISSASLHGGYTSQYCRAVMKSILPLAVMTPELRTHSHVSPLVWLLHAKRFHWNIALREDPCEA